MSDADAPTLPATPGDPAPPPVAARIGRFHTIGMLGAGGMGIVIEAHDPELDRRVAIKLLHAGGDGARLHREAQAMAKLAHPNVVAVYEVGRLDEQTFIAMELVEGTTLRGWGRERRPWREVVAMYVAAGRGLAAAHEAGMIHRDFKPDNVLVGADRRPRVSDFGLVASDGFAAPAAAALDVSLTIDGSAVGTPAYMSPEHWSGTRVDARSDQFSFCVALWEALHGVRPFDGETVDALRQAVVAGRIAPAPADALVPRWLTGALRRGLSPDPAARWPSMAALLATLEAGLAPPRRPLWIALGLAATGVAAAIAVLALRDDDARIATALPARPAVPAFALVPDSLGRLTFDDGCEEYPALAPDGRTIYFDATVGKDIHLFSIDVEERVARELTTTTGWDLGPRLSPDGTRLAFLRATPEMNMSLVVAPLAALDRPTVLAVSGGRPFWSPDGRTVWSSWHEQVVRHDAATGAVVQTLDAPEGRIAAQGVELGDGRVVILTVPLDNSASADRVVLYPAGGGAPVQLFEGSLWDALALLPDGDSVAIATRNDNHSIDLWRIPLDGSAATTLATGTITARSNLAIAGRRVVWSDCFARTSIATLDATGLNDIARSDWADYSPVAVPGTGTYYFVSDRTGQFTIFRSDRARPGPATPLALPDHSPGQLAVSADGRVLAFVDRRQGLLVVPTDLSTPPRLLAPDAIDVYPTIDRAGTTVYFTRAEGEDVVQVMSVPVAGGEPTRLVASAHGATASPTANVLAYLATVADGVVPTLRDLGTGASRPLIAGGPPGQWDALRWSADATRMLLVNSNLEVVEVDVATGATLRRFGLGTDVIDGVTYVGDEILVGRSSWSGDLWTAELRGRD